MFQSVSFSQTCYIIWVKQKWKWELTQRFQSCTSCIRQDIKTKNTLKQFKCYDLRKNCNHVMWQFITAYMSKSTSYIHSVQYKTHFWNSYIIIPIHHDFLAFVLRWLLSPFHQFSYLCQIYIKQMILVCLIWKMNQWWSWLLQVVWLSSITKWRLSTSAGRQMDRTF